MSRKTDAKPAIQTARTQDKALIDLSLVPNDADDHSDDGRPTTDHDAKGWRETPAAKP
jgi:hypothetical protein